MGGMNVIELLLIFLGIGLYYAYRIRFARSGAEADSQEARLTRIRFVARFFKWICCAGFGFVVFAAVIALAMPEMVGTKADLAGAVKAAATGPVVTMSAPIVLGDFKADCRWLYPVFWLLVLAFISRGIGFFYRLFSNLESGMVFGRDNVRCIQGIGWLLVAAPLLAVGFELSKLIWSVAGPGMIDLSNMPSDLLKGLFVLFIAWIMDEGRKIQEEQALTV
jgi:hypothetical protein